MAYTYTSKFVQLTSYLLMEYRYADEPTPETYFTNTGANTVGFNKLVNGYRNNSVQIFNPDVDSSITNNTADNSVVRYSEFSFVSLDQNLIVPFNDFSDELTNTTNLPITFPSNLLVVYDTVRYHVRAGYNLSNIDGLIASVEFPDQNGNYVTMSQILIQKGTNQEYDFNPSPITIGSAIYDKYIEVKIPNLKDMNDKYLAASDAFKPSTLAGLISESGTGFIYGAPLRISLWQVNKITSISGYDRYESAIISNLSLEQEDPFSNIGAVIKESDQGQFFEYYATDNEGFVEDFILFQNSIGNSYFISHQIQVVEQIGAAFIETSRFETIQTTAFDVPNYYRPIVKNAGVAASFTLRYTMSMVNNKDQSRVIRIGTYTSNNPSEWGTTISPIQLSTFPQVQKIYNRIYGQASQTPETYVEVVDVVRYVNNIIDQNYISTTFSNLTFQDSSPASTGSDPQTAFGFGKLNIEVSPFDNLYKFKIIKAGVEYLSGVNGAPTEVDLTSFGTLRMVFIQEKGEKLNIPSVSNNTVANPSKGEVLFKVDTSNSSIVLNLKDKRFFITAGNQESDPNKSLDPEGSISKSIKGSGKGSIKSRSLNRANALNAAKSVSSVDSFNSTVLYWGYWKASGDEDIAAPVGSGTKAIGLDSIPSVQVPINLPPKSPSKPSVNTITPSANQEGATGAASTQTVDPSSLTGTALSSSVISGIKNVFNLQGNPNDVSQSVIVNSLTDLYSKYPQISKSQFLSFYNRATNNLTGYSPLTIQAIKIKLDSELE